jgi:hypothetical protein
MKSNFVCQSKWFNKSGLSNEKEASAIKGSASVKEIANLKGAAIMLFLALGLSHVVQAQVAFDPAITYRQTKITDQSGAVGDSDASQSAIDLKLSYFFREQSLFVGGIYKLENSDFTGGTSRGYLVGPVIGWRNNGWMVDASYQFIGERVEKIGGTETKFTEPGALQIDAAYTYMVTPRFGLGPQLTYRDVKYDKSNVGSAGKTSAYLKDRTFEPYIAMHFDF